jgi:hypothetical protein
MLKLNVSTAQGRGAENELEHDAVKSAMARKYRKRIAAPNVKDQRQANTGD